MSTNDKIQYIDEKNDKYTINKTLIKENLQTVKLYNGSDKLAKKVYTTMLNKRNQFINRIANMQEKINQKSNINSDTVKNLKDYISRFQKIKDDMKDKVNTTEQEIEALSSKINEMRKSQKNIILNNTENNSTLDVDENKSSPENELSEHENQLKNAKKSISLLKSKIDLVKDINRDIKLEVLNSFGEASIKTVNNCINNFIKTFNLQIDAWNKVLGKKETHKNNSLKKAFSQNASRLTNIKKNLSSTKLKSQAGYWFNKYQKIIDGKNILESESEKDDFKEYDKFLNREIQKLKSEIFETMATFKSDGKSDVEQIEQSKKSIQTLYDKIQSFRESLIEHIYNSDTYNTLNRKFLDGLFKLAIIKCYVDLYTEADEPDSDFLNNIGQIKHTFESDNKDVEQNAIIMCALPMTVFTVCTALSFTGAGTLITIIGGIVTLLISAPILLFGSSKIARNRSYIRKAKIDLNLNKKELKQIKDKRKGNAKK